MAPQIHIQRKRRSMPLTKSRRVLVRPLFVSEQVGHDKARSMSWPRDALNVPNSAIPSTCQSSLFLAKDRT